MYSEKRVGLWACRYTCKFIVYVQDLLFLFLLFTVMIRYAIIGIPFVIIFLFARFWWFSFRHSRGALMVSRRGFSTKWRSYCVKGCIQDHSVVLLSNLAQMISEFFVMLTITRRNGWPVERLWPAQRLSKASFQCGL